MLSVLFIYILFEYHTKEIESRNFQYGLLKTKVPSLFLDKPNADQFGVGIDDSELRLP